MRPVTWSRASVSVNDLSPAPSAMPAFPGLATWMPPIRWAAAKVSELWPSAGVRKNVTQSQEPIESPLERRRCHVRNVGEK